MISFSHASISFRALLATVAVVGAAGFVVGRNSQPPFVISPLTLCSRATEAAFPEFRVSRASRGTIPDHLRT